jgi:hypothetical protein
MQDASFGARWGEVVVEQHPEHDWQPRLRVGEEPEHIARASVLAMTGMV